MADYVKITPLTRLEGHLGITAKIADDKVITAYSHGEMFRGFEKILIGRDPRDAPVITSRTCGVCHFIHRHTSLRAIETAAGFAFPFAQAFDDTTESGGFTGGNEPGSLYGDGINPRWLGPGRNTQQGASPSAIGGYSTVSLLPLGAQLARNIVHALTYVYSHAAHTIALAAPDYKDLIDTYIRQNKTALEANTNAYLSDAEKNGTESFFENFLAEAVVAQRIIHELLGALGGKVPHQMSAIPGGFTTQLSGGLATAALKIAAKRVPHAGKASNLASGGQSWPLLEDSGDGVVDLDTGNNLLTNSDWICARVVPFTLGLLYGVIQTEAHTWGVGSGNFVCAGTFDIVRADAGSVSITGDQYFRSGVYLGNSTDRGRAPGGDSRYRYGLDPTTGTSAGDAWMTVYEDITSGKYPSPELQPDGKYRPICGGLKDPNSDGYPGNCETHPLVSKNDPNDASRYIYTWYKATRVKDSNDNIYVVESGPLARLVVNGVDPNLNLGDLSGLGFPGIDVTNGIRNALGGIDKSSTGARLFARLQDTLLIIDMLIGTDYSGENKASGGGNYYWLNEINQNKCWLTRLVYALDNVDDPLPASVMWKDAVVETWETLGQGAEREGSAFWDAPRGITCHFCKVLDGRLTQYQHIAGTTWNGNGRDQLKQPGPFEWSLMNFTRDWGSKSLSRVGTTRQFRNESLSAPIVERSVTIKYKLFGQWWEAYDVPKLGEPPEGDKGNTGEIVGPYLENTSYVDYTGGKVYLYFRGPDVITDGEIDDMETAGISIDYGFAGTNAVPAPAEWEGQYGYGYGKYGYDGNPSYPNPINILRTIRSYDPCLACSIHVVDRKGKARKYEVLPVAGWDI
jgi:Ni,Fe-hydrogenase I large subunit